MNQNYFASVTADQLRTVMNEKLFSSVLNVMQCGVQVLKSVLDGKGNVIDFDIIYSNKIASLYKGNKTEGRRLSDNGNDPDAGEFFQKVLRALFDGKVETHIRVHESGNASNNIMFTITKLVDGALVTNEKCDDQSLSPIKSLLDVRDLNRTNEIMNIALKSAGAGLGYWNPETGKATWDEKGRELMGLPDAEDYTLEECISAIHPDDRDKVTAYALECASQGKEFLMEYRVLHNNAVRHLLGTGLFKKNADGSSAESYGLVIDITNAKLAEEKIHALSKSLSIKNRALESANSEIKTFSSIASNDYKETLQMLYTNLEFILTKDARNLSDAGKGNLRKMQASIQKLKLLTDDIVSFSNIHIKEEEPEDVDLDMLLKTLLEDMHTKIEEEHAKITADTLPHISGFPQLLSLLFHHLLDNALKFRKREVPPVIRIEYEKVSGKSLGYTEREDLLFHQLSVIDNGIGFDNSESEKLFLMFYRIHEKNRYKGSGIGLAICKKIMDLHHGFIKAEGEVNKGATFSCYFPAENYL